MLRFLSQAMFGYLSQQCFCLLFSLQVVTKEHEKDPLRPLYIGPEKLLSLYSENNWGNFCLSYLLTNRDYSGVLGLAWEGKTGESELL